MEICNVILENKSLDEGISSTLLLILRNQGRRKLRLGLGVDDCIVTLYKNAYEAAPGNEEQGKNWALATVRARDFKQTQFIAMALYRKFKKDQYMYWYVMSLLLQVENDDPNSMVFLNLGEKMMDKNIGQGKVNTYEGLNNTNYF